jgi:hypothetical protein
MNIVVCVKQVPDTAVERTLTPGAGTLDRDTPDGLINELDEYAIEEGLKIAEACPNSSTKSPSARGTDPPRSQGVQAVEHLLEQAPVGYPLCLS